MSASGGDAFSNKDHRGAFIEIAEFAGGVYEQTLDGAGLERALRAELGPINKFQPARGEVFARFLSALKVPRHDDQEKIRETRAEAQKHIRENGFFSGMSAAPDENRRAFINAQLPQQGVHIDQRPFRQLDGVEL